MDRQGKIANECIWDKVGVATIEEKMMKMHSRWFGHLRKIAMDATIRNFDLLGDNSVIKWGRGRLKKKFMKTL